MHYVNILQINLSTILFCHDLNKNIYFDVFTNIIKHKVLVYHFKGSVIKCYISSLFFKCSKLQVHCYKYIITYFLLNITSFSRDDIKIFFSLT